jgi:hypothetical protein
MDFSNHPINQRNIDNRVPKPREINKSIIEGKTFYLRNRLQDQTIDSRMVAKICQTLSEKDIEDFTDYALRKANNPGRAFVKLCYNAMQYKSLDK